MPVKSLITKMSSGVSSFEMIENRLLEISPMIPKYPFVIIGISHEARNLEVQELTSVFDNFLIENTGLSFLEMKIQAERSNYDFKAQLSPQPHNTAKEICALANHKNGGLILVGVGDNGDILGVPSGTFEK